MKYIILVIILLLGGIGGYIMEDIHPAYMYGYGVLVGTCAQFAMRVMDLEDKQK